jgi:hypothetical protein
MFQKFFFDNYCDKVKPLIQNIILAKRKPFVNSPTFFQDPSPLFTDKLKTAFYVRQSHMREGFLAQALLGNWPG